jgi:hypothetical protein
MVVPTERASNGGDLPGKWKWGKCRVSLGKSIANDPWQWSSRLFSSTVGGILKVMVMMG